MQRPAPVIIAIDTEPALLAYRLVNRDTARVAARGASQTQEPWPRPHRIGRSGGIPHGQASRRLLARADPDSGGQPRFPCLREAHGCASGSFEHGSPAAAVNLALSLQQFIAVYLTARRDWKSGSRRKGANSGSVASVAASR